MFLSNKFCSRKLYNVLIIIIIMVMLLKKKKDFTFMQQQIQVFSTCKFKQLFLLVGPVGSRFKLLIPMKWPSKPR